MPTLCSAVAASEIQSTGCHLLALLHAMLQDGELVLSYSEQSGGFLTDEDKCGRCDWSREDAQKGAGSVKLHYSAIKKTYGNN